MSRFPPYQRDILLVLLVKLVLLAGLWLLFFRSPPAIDAAHTAGHLLPASPSQERTPRE